MLWYCGDNGTSGDGIVTSPLRGQKADLYDGGIRVPGLIEWPVKISQPTTSEVPTVTTDILPTLCELAGVAVPQRPLDGVSLVSLLDGQMKQRNQPICFWSFDHRRESQQDPYLPEETQQGTTPLVKLMKGNATRNFVNFHHREIEPKDFGGTRVILDDRLNQYPLPIIRPGDATQVRLHPSDWPGRFDQTRCSHMNSYGPSVNGCEVVIV